MKIDPTHSRYFSSTPWLHANERLEVPGQYVRILFLAAYDAGLLADFARKRNVFARTSWENKFYIQRIRDLGERTVIEVGRPGDPDDMISQAKKVSSRFERLAVLSSILAIQRPAMHRALGVSSESASIDVTVGRNFYYLRSSQTRVATVRGLEIDGRFVRRFNRCGFPKLLEESVSIGKVALRLDTASRWFFESRLEPSDSAAFVKTAIALESLLILDESEPLRRTLSERAAFLLSEDPKTRRVVGKLVKSLYDIRSKVVHGSAQADKDGSRSLLEGGDRLVLLLLLTVAANKASLPSMEKVCEWCDLKKWGEDAPKLGRPFPKRYLTGALNLAYK